MTTMTAKKIYRAYLRRDDYYAFRKLSPSEDDLPLGFDQWSDQAAEEEARLRAQGCIVERIFIDPQEFAAWSRQTGFSPNRVGREAFAIQKASGRVKA